MPGHGQVILCVEAVELNRSDVQGLDNLRGADLPRRNPAALGREIAGTIAETGPQNTGSAVGDLVGVARNFESIEHNDYAYSNGYGLGVLTRAKPRYRFAISCTFRTRSRFSTPQSARPSLPHIARACTRQRLDRDSRW
ncbi:alcohol dehydrogenase catalytic domain-containing protein [Rhodococcus sp. (in: high G+C Gram-positive bacteria)]|uniref:alcohol dehydrogenase catalytic domain-containing protein n=1 Tax=Rhodococcus sp. TaxID=1831 RepID=UPI00338DA550